MSERDESTTGIELLLMDAEVLAWLEDYRPERVEPDDEEPPAAA